MGLPSRLPYKYGFKAVLGLLVWLLVMLGGGIPVLLVVGQVWE